MVDDDFATELGKIQLGDIRTGSQRQPSKAEKEQARRARNLDIDLPRLTRSTPTAVQLPGPNPLVVVAGVLDITLSELQDLLELSEAKFERLWDGSESPGISDLHKLLWLALFYINGEDLAELARSDFDWEQTLENIDPGDFGL